MQFYACTFYLKIIERFNRKQKDFAGDFITEFCSKEIVVLLNQAELACTRFLKTYCELGVFLVRNR